MNIHTLFFHFLIYILHSFHHVLFKMNGNVHTGESWVVCWVGRLFLVALSG